MDKTVIRTKSREEARIRIGKLKVGDPVTNVCPTHKNPFRHAYFKQIISRSHLKKGRFSHYIYNAVCSDHKSKTWEADIETTYPGHLSDKECNSIYEQTLEVLIKQCAICHLYHTPWDDSEKRICSDCYAGFGHFREDIAAMKRAILYLKGSLHPPINDTIAMELIV